MFNSKPHFENPSEAALTRTAAVRWAVLLLMAAAVSSLALLPTTARAQAEQPSAPGNFSAWPGDESVTLIWTNPDDGGSAITKYQYRQWVGTGPSGNWTNIADSAPGGMNNTTYTISPLDNGTTYGFDLRAVNAVGPGPPAIFRKATPADLVNGEAVIFLRTCLRSLK